MCFCHVKYQVFRQRDPPFLILLEQEAFEKCWAHSPLRAAARRLFYIAIHQVSLQSHAGTVARRLRIDVHNNDDNNNNDNA